MTLGRQSLLQRCDGVPGVRLFDVSHHAVRELQDEQHDEVGPALTSAGCLDQLHQRGAPDHDGHGRPEVRQEPQDGVHFLLRQLVHAVHRPPFLDLHVVQAAVAVSLWVRVWQQDKGGIEGGHDVGAG